MGVGSVGLHMGDVAVSPDMVAMTDLYLKFNRKQTLQQ